MFTEHKPSVVVQVPEDTESPLRVRFWCEDIARGFVCDATEDLPESPSTPGHAILQARVTRLEEIVTKLLRHVPIG